MRKFLAALGATGSRRLERRGRRAVLPSGAARLPPGAQPIDTRVSILECAGLGSYPLERGIRFRIGRSTRSDLVLPISSVSRHHAAIEWGGDAFHCHDLLSQNGTYCNGKRVTCWRLQVGDEIRIGGVSIRFRERSCSPFARFDGTEGWRSACLVKEKAVRSATLRGDLARVKLQEIVPFLELHRMDGVLEVGGRSGGRIYFSGGEIVQARKGRRSGVDAFFGLMDLSAGMFLFREGKSPIDRAIRAPATALILEALRRRDEWRERGGGKVKNGAQSAVDSDVLRSNHIS
ncbi:MAG: FHA domain-containing protein [Planctomycetota bacterium]|nr:FHA domain-containing protein [Planctomycetota bacterium]